MQLPINEKLSVGILSTNPSTSLLNTEDSSEIVEYVVSPDVNEHVELQMGSFQIDPVLPVRPCEYNTIVFTADMIKPVFYNADNFKPICIDNVSVPQQLLDLASLSPSFSPTPTFADGNILHKDLMEYVLETPFQNVGS